jgi:hypothetical protein
MECGDKSPLWTGQFIGPPGMSRGGRGGEINGRLSGSALEIAVKSGDKSPHSTRVIFADEWHHSTRRM